MHRCLGGKSDQDVQSVIRLLGSSLLVNLCIFDQQPRKPFKLSSKAVNLVSPSPVNHASSNTNGSGRIYMQTPKLQRSPIRYRNHFRWRIMPPDEAVEQGFFDRSFPNKQKATTYQKRVKAKYPNALCCLIDTGKWLDALGNIVR